MIRLFLAATVLAITLTTFAQQPPESTPGAATSAVVGDPGPSTPTTATSAVAVEPQAITDAGKLGSRTVPDMQSFSIEKLYMTRLMGGSTWSPDGKQVAFISNISGRNNLWLVPAAGGWPTQLTISDQRQAQPTWSPDGAWIAYISDHDGDEQWDIFLVSPRTGEVTNLTLSPDSAEINPAWSPDGKQLAYITKPKTGSSYELELIDIATRHLRHLTRNTPKELSNTGPIFSRDGKFIVYTQRHATGKDSGVFVVDLASGQSTNLTPHKGWHNYDAADISPDGRTVLITSDARNGYNNVGLLDVATRKIDWLTEEKWELSAGSFSPDGKSVTWTANVDGTTNIYTCDLAARRVEALPISPGVNTPAGHPTAFTRDGSRLLYYHNGADAPGDLWVYDVASKQSQQITHSLVAGLRSSDMVEPYLVHYPSRDGKWTISAFAYVPNSIQPNGKFPAIVYIHGGPAAQSVDSFNRLIQYMVNQGYLVIAPNYRGSTGYGKAFTDANMGDGGGQELNDVLDAAEWIRKSPFVDPKKLIVMGGSYGGYLTMMAVTKAPDMWAAGVALVPFVNWFTEIANEDPRLREYDLATMGDPAKNKALYEDRSPINFVDHIKAPLLLLAGGNDPRCPAEEAQQVADAVKKRGGTAQLKIYSDEGHGFARVSNQIDAYQRVSDFLKVHVPSPGCGCSVYE
ncbi:MAG TPA: S9 family peptidase [Candidatus Binatia bacterium]|nr:S9 family peptidase [Candidatus Binatia bacterium]